MSQCLKPLHIKIEDSDRYRIVPCGKCNACLVRARMEWALRLSYEDRKALTSVFITLTYDNEHLPIEEYVEPDTGACFYNGVVCKRDVQLWLKRFRKSLDKEFNCKLRYYLISEYGPLTLRPHYHGIFFLDSVVSLDDLHRLAAASWSLCAPERVTVDYCCDERIKYVTEYCLTKAGIPEYLVPNFRLVSRNPGLGASYVDLMQKWHDADKSRFYAPDFTGHRINLPRYLREKVYDKETREEHTAELEAAKLQEEIAIRTAPDFDAVKYELDRRARIADYNRKTNFLLTKKIKKI